MIPLKTALFILALAASAYAQTPATDTTVHGQVKGSTLASPEVPGVSLDFAKSFTYAGAQRFVLYGVAMAEQHFFVETGPQQSVRRFYWVQFEHYLPTNTNRYRYKKDRVAKIGDLDFITDSRVIAHYFGGEINPASDSAKAKEFFQAKGYQIPEALVRTRCFYYLPDSNDRSELMIIYGEALTEADLGGGAIPAGESADEKYPQLAAKVLERLRSGVSIRRR